jgi:predicted dehydrogenase
MKFAIIGYGSIAKKHIEAIGSVYPGSAVTLIRRKNEEKPVMPEGISCCIATDIEEVQQSDYVFITNPTSLHASTISRVLRFNKPLLIEKPLADKTDEVEGIIDPLNNSGVTNYVACNMRFHPCIGFLKDELLPGIRINEANSYCGSYLPEWRPGIDFRTNYSAVPELGGGVHLDLIHELDYSCYLFGMPEKSISSRTSRSSLNLRSTDFAHYCWTYREFSLQITLNYYRRDYARTLELVAEDATYLIDFKNGTVHRGSEMLFSSDPDPKLMYRKQLKYFIENAEQGKKCFNDIKEAYQVLKLCLE